MNEEIILSTLNEIRADQKVIVEKLSRMDRDMEISRNGYTPHQIVEMFHFIDDLKEKEKRKAETIRKAVINWVTPILLSGVILGLLQMYKG
jgi:hypothetical protein